MAELANCSRCDAVFVKNIRNICQNCYKIEEAAFKTVYEFLRVRKNREATMREIVEATKVEESLIIKFTKEKRLITSQFPNLAYPCNKCGSNILTGNICNNCSDELQKDLIHHDEIEKKSQENQRIEKQKSNTYYSYDN